MRSRPDTCILLIAIAGVAATPLDYTRHIDGLQVQNQQLLGYADVDHDLIGDSKAIAVLVELIKKVAASDSTALIVGEMGTGKELVARAIHRNSSRAKGPFIAVNCAAIPKHLIASELFGYERGAFTGAKRKELTDLLANAGSCSNRSSGHPPGTKLLRRKRPRTRRHPRRNRGNPGR